MLALVSPFSLVQVRFPFVIVLELELVLDFPPADNSPLRHDEVAKISRPSTAFVSANVPLGVYDQRLIGTFLSSLLPAQACLRFLAFCFELPPGVNRMGEVWERSWTDVHPAFL